LNIVNFCKENTSTDLKVILKKRLKKFVQTKEKIYEPKFISVSIKFDASCKEYQKYWKIVRCTKNRGTAVAQWLRCCALNRMVAASVPDGVSGFFIDIKILPIALWLWGRVTL
jgi:hypothetical protein